MRQAVWGLVTPKDIKKYTKVFFFSWELYILKKEQRYSKSETTIKSRKERPMRKKKCTQRGF